MSAGTSKNRSAAVSGKTAASKSKTSASKGKTSASKGKAVSANSKTTAKSRSSQTVSKNSRTNSSSSSAKNKKSAEKQETVSPSIVKEALIWCLLAVCIIMFISFFGICGYLGSIISDICFGIFGIMAYLFPPLLFLGVSFGISNNGSRLSVSKICSGAVLYLCLCCFAALFEGQYGGAYEPGKMYAHCATMKQGGGVIGGTVCHISVPALGQVGAGVLFGVIAVISIVMITQKSLFRGVRKQGTRVYESARKISEQRSQTGKKKRTETQNMEWDMPGTDEDDIRDGRLIQDVHEEPSVLNGFDAEFTSSPRKSEKSGQRPEKESGVDISVMFAPATSQKRHHHHAGEGMTDIQFGDHEEPDDCSLQNDYDTPGRQREDSFINLGNIPLNNEKLPDEDGSADEPEEGSEYGSEDESADEYESVQDVYETEDETADEAVPSAPASDAAPSGTKKHNPRSSETEIAKGIASVEAEAAKAAKAVQPEYVFPPLSLLKKGDSKANKGQEQEIKRTAAKLQQTLNSFGVHVKVTDVSCGPSVTRYELLPEQGVKVSRIVALSDDIKLNLAAADIRIEAPIPGKSAVGIEVPNAENSTVALRDLLESDEFRNFKSKLAFATGKDLSGKVVVSDIAKMPHLLIAGATGSGKSVCINTLIMSILYKAKPDEVKLIMIDPKVVELSVYNGIPHLFIPVVTDPKKAAGALNWAVAEMTDRYSKFAEAGVRDLKGYNKKIEALKDVDDPDKPEKLPQIVIIVDELADLMMVAPGEVEDSICRLAQLARAAGIHLVIATQRPSVNVITGLIKANMPSRIAFAVSSGVDSRTIIDMYGAEKLLGKGDMLFYPQGYQKPVRVQGAFVSDEEVSDVVDFLKNNNVSTSYDEDMEKQIAKVQLASSAAGSAEDTDELFTEAGKFIIEKDKASIGMLQRVFKIGFNRAARIMDQLSDAGVVGPEEGTKPRKILMSMEQFENYLEEN